MRRPTSSPVPGSLRRLALLAAVAATLLVAGARAGGPERTLEDFTAPPGTPLARPTMLQADYSEGYDRRLPLDTLVYALENGSRACRVLKTDSLWVVDYTWVYPHTGMPKRWYDAEDLLRVGDSLGLGDDANVVFTFGTYRLGVRAGSYEQVLEEARRLRPAVMPRPLAGRLRLKLERADSALARAAAAPPVGAPKP